MESGQNSGLSAAVSYQYVSTLATVAFGGVFYVFIAKFFSTSVVGAIALLLAISSLISIIFSFSLPISAQHFLSYNLGKGDRIEMYSLIKRFVTMSIILAIASAVFTILTAGIFSVLFFHDSSYTLVIRVASLYIVALIMFGVLHGSALGLQLFKIDAIIYLSSASISYFIGLILLGVFHNIIYLMTGFILSYFCGTIVYSVVIFLTKSAIRGRSKKTLLPLIVSYSWPLILSALIGYGSQYLDRFVVAYFLDISTLGIYSFVLLVSSSIGLIAQPIANILLPKLSEYFSLTNNDMIRRSVNMSSAILMLVYSPLAMGGASISPILLTVLAKSGYESGSVALMVLLTVSSFFILWNIMNTVISAIRKTKVYVVSTTVTLLSNVLLSLLLIPKVGMVGAAIANSSVMVVSFLVLYYYAIVKEARNFDWTTVIKIWLASVLVFVVVLMERISLGNHLDMLPLYIVTGAFVYLAGLNLTRSLTKLGRDEFIELMPKKFGFRRVAEKVLFRAF